MLKFRNLNSVMGARDHFKNGVNSKKRANKGKFIRGVCFLIILIMVVTCNKENEMDKFMSEPPPVITISQVENGLKISWNEVQGRNNYQLWRSEDNFSGNTLMNFWFVYEPFYIDENPIEGVNYYKVAAQKCKRYDINLSASEKDCRSLESDVVSFNYTSNK